MGRRGGGAPGGGGGAPGNGGNSSEIVSSMRDESSAEASKVGRREVESEPEPSLASPPGTKLSPLTDEPATDEPEGRRELRAASLPPLPRAVDIRLVHRL